MYLGLGQGESRLLRAELGEQCVGARLLEADGLPTRSPTLARPSSSSSYSSSSSSSVEERAESFRARCEARKRSRSDEREQPKPAQPAEGPKVDEVD